MPKGRRSHLHPRSGRAVRCPNDGWRRVEAGAVVRSRCLGSPCPGAGLPSPLRPLPLRPPLPAAPHLSPRATSSRTCVSRSTIGTSSGMGALGLRGDVPWGTSDEAAHAAPRREIRAWRDAAKAGSLPRKGRTEVVSTSTMGRAEVLRGFGIRHVQPAGPPVAPRRPVRAAVTAPTREALPSPTWAGRDTSVADESAKLIILGRPPCTRR